jgi:hypothetical protein
MIEDIYTSPSSNTDQISPVSPASASVSSANYPGFAFTSLTGEMPPVSSANPNPNPVPISPFLSLPQKPVSSKHQAQVQWMKEKIAYHRLRIGLDARWVIECTIMSGRTAECEASVWWDSELKYAVISLRSDLSEQLANYVLVHELFELLEWETADHFVSAIDYIPNEELRGLLLRQYRAARNRMIEIHTTNYLQQQRPGHLFADHEMVELSPNPANPAQASSNTDAFRLRMSAQMRAIPRTEQQ